MPTMRPRLFFVCVFLFCVAVRIPIAAGIFEGRYHTVDELEVIQGGADRWLGVPLSNTHWPALINQALLVPYVGVKWLTSGGARNLEGLSEYLGRIYRDPWSLGFAGRMLVATAFALGAAALCASLVRVAGGSLLPAVLALCLLHTEHLVIYSSCGLGNGMAMGFLLLSAAALIFTRAVPEHRATLALGSGVCFACAAVSRNVSVLFLPVLIGLAWPIREVPARRGALAYLLTGMAVAGFLVALPAALDPLRWLKANLGNYMKVGAPVGTLDAANVLVNTGTAWYWAIVAAVIVASRPHARYPALVGWLASLVIAVVIAGRASAVATRYFDSLLLGGAVIAPLVFLERLGSQRTAAAPGWTIRSLTALAAVVACLGIVRAKAAVGAAPPLRREVDACLTALARLEPVPRVAVPIQLIAHFTAHASRTSLEALAASADRARLGGAGLEQLPNRLRLSPTAGRALGASFLEKDVTYAARLQSAALAPPSAKPVLDLTLYGEAWYARRFGVTTLDVIAADLRAHRLTAVVSEPGRFIHPATRRLCQGHGFEVWLAQ